MLKIQTDLTGSCLLTEIDMDKKTPELPNLSLTGDVGFLM